MYSSTMCDCFIEKRPRTIMAGTMNHPYSKHTRGQYPDTEANLSQVQEAAVQWLAYQQNGDGSWPNLNTQNAILGLQLANQSWLASQGTEERLLTISRLEYELMRQLLPVSCGSGFCTRNSIVDRVRFSRSPKDGSECCPSTFERGAGILAQYMLSLQSVCIPTDDFYGVDLKCTMENLLRDFPEDNFNNFFQYSLAILSLCSYSNVRIFKKALLKLADGSDPNDPCFSPFGDNSGHNIDILSMQVMAMVCARDEAMEQNVPNWDSILSTRVQCIIDGQEEDGSFGDAITTALAIQALTAADSDPTTWSCSETVTWLLNQQTGGDFGGVAATAQIIPFLDCNNLGSLRNITIDCPNFDEPPMPPPIYPGDPTATFNIKTEVNGTIYTYNATILEGENLYFGMLRLADSDPNFTFTSSDSTFGQFLVSINGLASDAAASLYWSIYIFVDGVQTFAPTGIEGLFPEEGDCFQFGYTDFSK